MRDYRIEYVGKEDLALRGYWLPYRNDPDLPSERIPIYVWTDRSGNKRRTPHKPWCSRNEEGYPPWLCDERLTAPIDAYIELTAEMFPCDLGDNDSRRAELLDRMRELWWRDDPHGLAALIGYQPSPEELESWANLPDIPAPEVDEAVIEQVEAGAA